MNLRLPLIHSPSLRYACGLIDILSQQHKPSQSSLRTNPAEVSSCGVHISHPLTLLLQYLFNRGLSRIECSPWIGSVIDHTVHGASHRLSDLVHAFRTDVPRAGLD